MRHSAFEQRSVTLPGGAVHYRIAGAGPAVILLHGLSGSFRWWERNIGPLSQHFQIFAIDLPGFGDNHARGPFVLEDVAALLVDWMNAAGVERASMIGHSMGGVIAADFASRAPARIDRLMLVDVPLLPYARSPARLTLDSAAAARRLPLRFLPILISDAVRAGPFTLRKAGRELLAADLGCLLGRITAPALVVWGEHDRLFPPAYGRRVADSLPGAELIVINGAGHNPMWDQAVAFNRIALDFLS